MSPGVKVCTLPPPKLTPLLKAAPGNTKTMFAPILAIVFCMARFDPSPISIMAITAPTAMMTPSAERAERILFRLSAPKAVRNVCGMNDPNLRRCGLGGTPS